VLFFPAAIFIADLLVDGANAFREVFHPWVGGLLLAGITAALLVWGLKETKDIVNPVTIFTTPADIRALDWIKVNTPATARFYINAVHWQSGVYRGVDGGFWLEPYVARQSLLPPVIYAWGPREYSQQIKGWAELTTHLKGCTADFKELVREAGLTYIYLRQGQGTLQPDMLTGCKGLTTRYEQGGVFIYEIQPDFLGPQ
jgi:hypothetical protein